MRLRRGKGSGCLISLPVSSGEQKYMFVCFYTCFLTIQVFLFFLTPVMPWIHREWIWTIQAPFHWFSWSVCLWVEQAGRPELCAFLCEGSGSFPTYFSCTCLALQGRSSNGGSILTKWWGEKWSEALVARSCPTLCDPMDWSPPGSSVRGILQARILEWVVISFSRGNLPDPEFEPRSPALQTDSLPSEEGKGREGRPQNSWVKFETYKFSPWLLIL